MVTIVRVGSDGLRRLGRVIEITERAIELIAKAQVAARRFDPSALIRIVGQPDGVRFELAGDPGPGDEAVKHGDLTIYVDPHLSGVVDVEEPHDRLVLRPRSAEV